MQKFLSFIALLVIIAAVAFLLRGKDDRLHYPLSNGQNLDFQIKSEEVIRFAFTKEGESSEATDMVDESEFRVPVPFHKGENLIETSKLIVKVDPAHACFTVEDKERRYTAAKFCATADKELSIQANEMENIYGLGEQFISPGSSAGDWKDKVREATPDSNQHNRGPAFGNNMHGFNGGAVGNAQFPIMYGVGSGHKNFAFFFDNTYRHRWDFTSKIWKLETTGGTKQGYVIVGPDLTTLRQNYMRLTGRPPVPPRKAFGLWISEYGFDNWKEMDDKLKSLRANKFPVDGVVLDLQWFGGIKTNDDNSPMGGLTWDIKNFPEPKEKIASLNKDGIGVIAIEESYISKGVLDPQTTQPVHDILESKGYLATETPEKNSKAAYITYNPWWGRGGMLDWTNEEGAAYWHDWRRQPLIETGLMGHWTDLGEPEMFEPESYYSRGTKKHADIHNIYNLKWSQSIFKGYQRHNVQQRPWILSRSGTSGIQRYGVGMWSGDIGSNLTSLTTHMNAQMHMSFSGVDYFGSDIGGFHRKALEGNLNEMYTQWFANGALLDVPVRVHTENLCNCKETAPDRIGDKASNLFNIRLRYELLPYYYSLAHMAYKDGLPLIAPLVFYFQDDVETRQLGDQKMIGPYLMAATVSRHGDVARDVYLPRGNWFDYHTHKMIPSEGQVLTQVPAKQKNIFRLPLFAREGAIIPKNRVTETSRGSEDVADFVLRVYPSTTASEFTMTEDDGKTTAYISKEINLIKIDQVEKDNVVTIKVNGTMGASKESAREPAHWLELATKGRPIKEVSVNGQPLQKAANSKALESEAGWIAEDSGLLIAKTKNVSRAGELFWTVRF